MVIIETFEADVGIYQSLRESVSIASSSAGLNLSMNTAEVAMVNIILLDDGSPLSDIQINLVNTDKGNLNSPYSNDLGIIELKIEPGFWDMELKLLSDYLLFGQTDLCQYMICFQTQELFLQ